MWYDASTLTIIKGAIASGALSDTYSINSVDLVLTEVGGAPPGFNYEFRFGDVDPVETPDLHLFLYGYYDGNAGHDVILQQYNYDTASWVAVTGNPKDFNDGVASELYNFTLINDADYLDSGNITVRTYHSSAGNPTHRLYIDRLWLIKSGFIGKVYMMFFPKLWNQNQQNTITFVLYDDSGTEVAGLGGTFNLFISKNGAAFQPSAGTKSEVSDGWYKYVSTAAEADTRGPVSIYVSGTGIVQQNLEYVVEGRNAGAIEYEYTVLDSVSGLPVAGVEVWVSTDVAGANIIWSGVTDAFGVARDVNDAEPWLDAGTYFFWKHRVGYTDDDMPDTEVVS